MYFLDDEEFYTNKYAEEIQALEEAVRNSVRREILDEMNRLKRENEELQDVKEHFDEVKADYERKKAECDRIIADAEHKAKKARLEEILEEHKLIRWRISHGYAYGPKCEKCDENRQIEIILPSGKKVYDDCKCRTEGAQFFYPIPCELVEISDKYGLKGWYKERTHSGSEYYEIYSSLSICDDSMKKKIEDWKKKKMPEKESYNLLFDSEEECQSLCDTLNAKRKHPEWVYEINGKNFIERKKNEQ